MYCVDTLTKKEMHEQLSWLENEIDVCLQYDFPIHHLEEEQKAIAIVLSMDTGIQNIWVNACGYYHRVVDNIKVWKQYH